MGATGDMIYDEILEISFLFPWAISLSSLSLPGYFAMVIFLILLTLGFVYEYKKGALEWE